MNLVRAFFIFTLLALCGCGYRPGLSSLSHKYTTISVPYVVGDLDGDLTAAIVREVVASLGFDHSDTDGELVLVVQLIDVGDENIGFRYEPVREKKSRRRQFKSGECQLEYKKSIIPTESRLIAIAEVSLIDAATNCNLVPTVRLSAEIDLDHEYNATYWDSTVRSLGQLTDADGAFAVARVPLNRALAKKIVEYIEGIGPLINNNNASFEAEE